MKPKDQGTRYETAIVQEATRHGLTAGRIAEGGRWDAGDVFLVDEYGDHWIIEAKARAALNPHKELAKAKAKTSKANLPFFTTDTVLFWKRLTRKEGNERRTPDGEPEIVCMTPDTFFALLKGL